MPAPTATAGTVSFHAIISYSRGHVHINDLDQIRQRACERDEDVRSHYDRIFNSNAGEQPVLQPALLQVPRSIRPMGHCSARIPGSGYSPLKFGSSRAEIITAGEFEEPTT